MRAMASSFLRFLDDTQRRITVGRTHLDEWSARRRDLYLTTQQHSQQTNIHAPGGIRTDLSRRTAADLHLRPCGHWDRRTKITLSNDNLHHLTACYLLKQQAMSTSEHTSNMVCLNFLPTCRKPILTGWHNFISTAFWINTLLPSHTVITHPLYKCWILHAELENHRATYLKCSLNRTVMVWLLINDSNHQV